jgi:hypothetical protein
MAPERHNPVVHYVIGVAAVAFGIVHALDAGQRLLGQRSIADSFPPLKALTNRGFTFARGAAPTAAANGVQLVGGLMFVLVGVLFLVGR